jgi:hypothetical protein
MGVKSPEAGTSTDSYENPEPGTYPARCIGIIDLGTKDNTWKGDTKKKREIIFNFELAELMEDGKPFVVQWWNNFSLAPGSNLTAILQAWRGAQFADDAEREAFDVGKVLDLTCQVSLVKNSNGRISVGKHGVTQLMKGVSVPDRVNPLVDFGIDDLGTAEYNKIYPWIQKFVIQSDEAGEFINGGGVLGGGEAAGDEEPPF